MSDPERTTSLQGILARIEGARRVVLTTHVNADGDGAGSEVALASWLRERGADAVMVNPTPWPEGYRFLLPDPAWVAERGTPEAERALEEMELLIVLDTGEPGRIGALRKHADPARTLVIDHHPVGPDSLEGEGVRDPSAAATGELIFDLLEAAGHTHADPVVDLALYVAIVTDTGSFRYSNTTPRTHQIAGELLRRGVDPEGVYRRLFATAPRGRLELLREALGTLETHPEAPVTWMVVTEEMLRRSGGGGEDLDGLIEHARSVRGTEVAILFRELADGGTKVSLRSNGDADVNALARRFGGGGHVKAAGALVGGGVKRVVREVVAAVAEAIGEARPRG
jgi:bifunctional oligoribonuclease and PAP phosphatase NrnA